MTEAQGDTLIAAVNDLAQRVDACGHLLAILQEVGLATCAMVAVLVFFRLWRRSQ